MFSHSLINFGSECTMSYQGPPSDSQKKLQKNAEIPSTYISIDKLEKANSSITFYIENTDDCKNEENEEKTESLCKTKVQQSSNDKFNDKEESVLCTSHHNKKISYITETLEKLATIEQSNSDEKDDDLIDILTKQLYLAENQLQKMQLVLRKAESRLKSKDQEIERLKRKVKDWEAKSRNQEIIRNKEEQQRKKQIENSEYLYNRCLTLEQKIFEMEKFLADYGLVWIGDTKINRSKRRDVKSNDFIKSCYAQLTANIEELNMSVGKGEIYVHRSRNGAGATFKTPSCICLRFYKNGMVVEDGKLRSYTNPNTISFIRDILDGYFPSELQKTYPDGVPFKVEDHRTEIYLGKGIGFSGHGYRLGKQGNNGFRNSKSRVTKSTISATAESFKSPSCANEDWKKYNYNVKTGMPSVPSTIRFSKQPNHSESPSLELLDLRSQILASHNNNCSDTHLQSHINAELGLSNRDEWKRSIATKTTECKLSVKEKSLSSRGLRSDSDCLSNRSRNSQTNRSRNSDDGFAGRSTLGLSFELSNIRSTNSSSGIRSRPRSASLNGERYPFHSYSRLSSSRNGSPSRNFNYGMINGTIRTRITKSATLEKTNELPIVHSINKPTGRSDEFRLKIRSINGSIVFLLHVSAEDTVSRLYRLLDTAISKGRRKNYKIVTSGYERKRLDDLEMTLRDYGISRDSVLHLVND